MNAEAAKARIEEAAQNAFRQVCVCVCVRVCVCVCVCVFVQAAWAFQEKENGRRRGSKAGLHGSYACLRPTQRRKLGPRRIAVPSADLSSSILPFLQIDMDVEAAKAKVQDVVRREYQKVRGQAAARGSLREGAACAAKLTREGGGGAHVLPRLMWPPPLAACSFWHVLPSSMQIGEDAEMAKARAQDEANRECQRVGKRAANVPCMHACSSPCRSDSRPPLSP